MKTPFQLGLSAIAALLLIASCSEEKKPGESALKIIEPVLPETPYDYQAKNLPSHIPTDFTSIENDKATLGRVLFYDNALSINNSVACASCHIQQFAFSDGKTFSDGVSTEKTSRNTLAIMNPSRERGLFWDLRESNLQKMVLKPIQNHVEMGFDKMDNVVANLNQISYYKPLFEKAFGTTKITPDQVGAALAQFLSSMKSHTSKYDIGKQSGFKNFNPLELLGKELFTQTLYCKSCHVEPDFKSSWGGSANIGLDLEYKDKGVGAIASPQSSSFYDGSFKIPSLRNIELTGPYMHDGRFKTLEEVVEHYNSGVKNHPNLDWNLNTVMNTKTGIQTRLSEPIKLNLTEVEKAALVAFMKTLTDNQFTNDVRFSNPFRVKP